jgi:hypothetical protein
MLSPISLKGLVSIVRSRRSGSGDLPTQILRWPTERARKWTCEFLNSAPTNDSVAAVIGIGSAVRPNVVSADLDLIVIAAAGMTLHLSPSMEIDLRVYSLSTIDAQIARGHDLLGWAIKFGKTLFQRDHCWDKIIDAWKDKLPLPSATAARERAAAAHERLAKVLESGDTDAVHEQAISYLTQLARAELLERGVYPASRPELASQLRVGNGSQIAEQLDRLLQNDWIDDQRIDEVLKLTA